MPDADQPHDDELFETFLDGATNESDRQSLLESLRADPARQRQLQLQGAIDDGLRRLFAVETPSQDAILAVLAESDGVVPLPMKRPRKARLFGIAAAVAASLLIVLSLSLLWPGARREAPYAAARPLVGLYQSAVDSGFEPSYECREPERFAETFQRRQGQALKLLPMPAGSRMLGLAYTGGLSRETTAMLSYVDDQPVMVFVDKAQYDRRDVAAPDGKLNVFRAERDGLVFYEVTPLGEAKVTPLLAPLPNDSR
jgi:hypothetical protein